VREKLELLVRENRLVLAIVMPIVGAVLLVASEEMILPAWLSFNPYIVLMGTALMRLPLIVAIMPLINRRNSVLLLLLTVYVYIIEFIGINHGWPYGNFQYLVELGPMVSGIPMALPLFFIPLVLNGYLLTLLIVKKSRLDRKIIIPMAIVLVILIDLVLDPAAGSGRLLVAVSQEDQRLAASPLDLYGVEKLPRLVKWAGDAVNRCLKGGCCRIVCGDGLDLISSDYCQELTGRELVDGIIANPPYVREKNSGPVFRSIRESGGWKKHLAPRQDLQQLFLALATERLAPGGTFVYLMNNYWFTSDAGYRVRLALSRQAEILNVIDFGSFKLFPQAPGQHNLLIHGVRRGGASVLAKSGMNWIRVKAGSLEEGESLADFSNALWESLEKGRVEPGLRGRATFGQGNEMVRSGPLSRWYLPSGTDRRLLDLERSGIPLGSCVETHQGIVSGADRVTRRNRVHLEPNISTGQGIFILTPEEVSLLSLNRHERGMLRSTYRARDIFPHKIEDSCLRIIYTGRGSTLEGCPNILRHLSRFRPLLSMRRECRNGKISWYELHWPRDPSLFERPRIVTPRRAISPRFAWGREGCLEQSDIALITSPADDRLFLQSLLHLLNSEVVSSWCLNRGKQKGEIREYFSASLEEIPVPRMAREAPQLFNKKIAQCAGAHPHSREKMFRALYR